MVRPLATVLLAACSGGAPSATDASTDAHDAPDDVVHDGGPCAPPTPGAPVAVGVSTLASIELSGLAASHTIADLLWTHADSGGNPEIFGLGATTAAAHGTLKLPGATAIDWEDIATAPCAAGRCIYVADTGDNNLVRASVQLYEVTEPVADPVGAIDVAFVKYDVKYPDGAHNVEALFIDPRDGKSYVITKVSARNAKAYELPRTAGATSTAVLLATLDVPSADPRVTAADMAVDGCGARILVRSHDALYELRGGPTATVPELLASPLHPMPVAVEPQGEAVAWRADGRAYFTISEGASPTLYRVDD